MNDIVKQKDLSSFHCPQLFVQFKWGLKSLEYGHVLAFSFSKEQVIDDVIRYLEHGPYTYRISKSDRQVLISVERICV